MENRVQKKKITDAIGPVIFESNNFKESSFTFI